VRQAARRGWRCHCGPLVFVWGTWLLLSWSLWDFVRSYGVNVPHFDEWEMVPVLTGEQPVTLKWLWSQHNEHRIFIPRLIYLALARATHDDFRAGMYFNVAALAAAAAGLVLLAARRRGTDYADAFFPVLILTLGQAENLYWSFQVGFVASAVLSVAVLMLCVGSVRMSFGRAMALGSCALMLPLIGGNGLALAPCVSVCVLSAGWDVWTRRPLDRWKAVSVWLMAVLAMALTRFYFVGYERPAKHPVSPSLESTRDAAMQFLTTGLGEAVKKGWPETRYVLWAWFVAVAALLAYVWFVRPEQRARAFRLLLFFAAMCSLAVGIGWARSALGPEAMFASRYTTLAAPFWCAVYLAWELLERSGTRRFAQTCLFFLAASFAAANHDIGMQEGASHHERRAGIVTDIRDGVPLSEVVRRHGWFTYYGGADVLAERMRMLRAHAVGEFRALKP
jgi:hypothetical protein